LFIEFYAKGKANVNPGTGVATWSMEEGEVLDIVITRVLDRGELRILLPKQGSI
jgi:hypothetical protein